MVRHCDWIDDMIGNSVTLNRLYWYDHVLWLGAALKSGTQEGISGRAAQRGRGEANPARPSRQESEPLCSMDFIDVRGWAVVVRHDILEAVPRCKTEHCKDLVTRVSGFQTVKTAKNVF
jgi:hypothetical protein